MAKKMSPKARRQQKEDAELNMPVETMHNEECAVEIAVDEMKIEESLPEDDVDEVSTQDLVQESPMEKLTIVEPLYEGGVENSSHEISMVCGARARQPRTSPYTKPPVELSIGPEDTIHYVPRHLLPHSLDPSGVLRQIFLRDMDIGTGHTFIHYFHTGLYETIDIEDSSTMLTTSTKFKQALSVYLATINHDIPCLEELAISEMRAHASRLDLVEFIRAIGGGFQSLQPESWVHEHLQQKSKAAFEEDHTVFTSQAFLNTLDTLDNLKVNKFMMRCMAKCYDDKLSEMSNREKERPEIPSGCEQSLRVLSHKNAVFEQNMPVQHQFITPLADEPITSECCGIETFQDDLVSNEDFCTISCPLSECSSEPQGCAELTNGSGEPGEHSQIARKLLFETDPAGPASYEQRLQPTQLAPYLSIEAIQEAIEGCAADDCGGEPKRSLNVLELQASQDSVSAQLVIDEKKETKKQKKMRKRKELQEMKELWEMTKRNRSDTAQGSSNAAESGAKPSYQNEVHKGSISHFARDDKRLTDLQAALTAMLNDVESIRSVHGK